MLPIGTESNELRWVYGTAPDSLTAPITAGQKITYIEIWYQDLCIARTDLLAINDVAVYTAPAEPELKENLLLEEGGKVIVVILVVLLAVVALGAIVLVIVRQVRIRSMRVRRRIRKHRRSY